MTAWRRSDLSPAAKRALVIIWEDGTVMKQAHYWCGPSKRKIFLQTILSFYERYLIKIVVESRHRRRQIAMLTDVGEYAAKEIQRELSNGFAYPGAPHRISEEAAMLIAEIV